MIVFHILDEAEALFPFDGMLELEDNETRETFLVDADGIKADYLEEVARSGGRTEGMRRAPASTTSHSTPGCRSTRP